MKIPSSRLPVLVFALLSTAGVLAQRGGSGAELTVSVTVSPICTVAVQPDDDSAQAVNLQCRNYAATQPRPLVTYPGPGAGLEWFAVVGDASVDVVVINF